MKISVEIPEGKYCTSSSIKTCKLFCDPEYGEPEDTYCNLFPDDKLPGEWGKDYFFFHTKHPDCPSLKVIHLGVTPVKQAKATG